MATDSVVSDLRRMISELAGCNQALSSEVGRLRTELERFGRTRAAVDLGGARSATCGIVASSNLRKPTFAGVAAPGPSGVVPRMKMTLPLHLDRLAL